jgi:hypothetical protein
VDVDTGVIVKSDVVFFSARIYAFGTTILALLQIDDHSPSLPRQISSFATRVRLGNGVQGQPIPHSCPGGHGTAYLQEISPAQSLFHRRAVSNTSFFG